MENKLLEAAREGNLAELRGLLTGGTGTEGSDDMGWTPLMWASAMGFPNIVKMLLESGANPERERQEWRQRPDESMSPGFSRHSGGID